MSVPSRSNGRPSTTGRPDLRRALMLEYPQHIAVYETYAEAEKAVDYLADNDFPVSNLCIVGTDLKTIERVQGRRTWGSVMLAGLVSGIFTGVFIGLMLGLFSSGGMTQMLLVGIVLGAAFGILQAAVGHGVTRGQRDFNSITQTVASRYEVLGEHRVAQRARDMLSQMPGERARLWNAGGSGLLPPADRPSPQQTPTRPEDQPNR